MPQILFFQAELLQSSQVQKSTGVTCDPLFIRTQQQQCHVRHSHCDIIRKKQAVTELFQLQTKKYFFLRALLVNLSKIQTSFATFVKFNFQAS